MSVPAERVQQPHPSPHLTPQFRARLLRLARGIYGAGFMAEDAVQNTLLAVWERGAAWHEGRVVLELRNQIRHMRRWEAARAHLNQPLED